MKVNNIFFTITIRYVLKYLQLFSEKTTSEEKDKNYFVKSRSEKKTNEEDNSTQSSKNSIESDKKEATSIYKNIRITQQSSKYITRKQKFVASLLLCHIVLQFFLPYSHFISKVSSLSTLIIITSYDSRIHTNNCISEMC